MNRERQLQLNTILMHMKLWKDKRTWQWGKPQIVHSGYLKQDMKGKKVWELSRHCLQEISYLFLTLLTKVKSESEVAQLCPTLCDPMDYI